MWLLISWWLAISWTFCNSWPRPFDDWKDMLFCIGAGIFCLYRLLKCEKVKVIINAPSIFFGLYVAFLFISLLGPNAATYEGLQSIARIVLWLGLVWCFSKLEDRHAVLLMGVSTVSAAIMALLSWLNLRGFSIWPFSLSSLQSFYPIGHISYYGDFMALHMPICGYLFFISKRVFTKIIWAVLFFIILMGLWITVTRSSALGLMAGLLLLAVLSVLKDWKAGLKLTAIYAAAFLLIMVLCNFVQHDGVRGNMIERFKLIPYYAGDIESLEMESAGRFSGYIKSARMVRDRPVIGWGAGSFRFNFPEYAYRHMMKGDHDLVHSNVWYEHPHNEILNQAVESGILGCAAFMAFVVSIYYLAIKALRRSQNLASSSIILFSLAGITISLVSWQFDASSLFSLSRMLTAFYGGLLWREVRHEFDHARRLEIGKKFIIPAVVAATFFTASYSAGLYAVERSMRSDFAEEKLLWATRAYHLAPISYEALFAYAGSQFYFGEREEGIKAADALLMEFPFVPSVLYQTALIRLSQGRTEDAKGLLDHALKNDPAFAEAKGILDALSRSDK